MNPLVWVRRVIAFAILCPVCAAQDSEIPDRDLQEAAARILSEPAFQGFDRFPDGTATAPSSAPPSSGAKTSDADGATSTDGEPGESTPRQPSTWWDRLRQSREKKAAEGQPAASPSSGTSSDKTAAESGRPDGGEPSPPSTKPPTDVARPQRSAGERTPPALRGHDGITRPVRFAPRTPRPQPEPSDWNWDFGLGELFGGLAGLLGNVFHLLAYVALAAVCVLILVLAARAIAENWPSRAQHAGLATARLTPLGHDRSPGETEADVFLRTALQLAEQGQYRTALAQLVLGAMSTIERRAWIRYRRGLTLNDYVRSVRSRPEQLSGLRTVVGHYEPVEFGRRPATAEAFGEALESYRQGFAEKSETRNPKEIRMTNTETA